MALRLQTCLCTLVAVVSLMRPRLRGPAQAQALQPLLSFFSHLCLDHDIRNNR